MNEVAIDAIPEPAESTALLDPKTYFAPAMDVKAAIARQQQFNQLVAEMLIPAKVTRDGNYEKVDMNGADYGQLPGSKTRMLYQPGAEKLALFFGLSVSCSCIEKIEDWENGFFFYKFKAVASYKGQQIRDAIRSCHTKEKKYRWVWVETVKPSEAEQEQMKAEGLGRNTQVWKNNKKVWVWQEQRPNPDPYSLQLVVEAMAQKRAKVAVVKEALAATGYFSTEIDLEDLRESFSEEEEPGPLRMQKEAARNVPPFSKEQKEKIRKQIAEAEAMPESPVVYVDEETAKAIESLWPKYGALDKSGAVKPLATFISGRTEGQTSDVRKISAESGAKLLDFLQKAALAAQHPEPAKAEPGAGLKQWACGSALALSILQATEQFESTLDPAKFSTPESRQNVWRSEFADKFGEISRKALTAEQAQDWLGFLNDWIKTAAMKAKAAA